MTIANLVAQGYGFGGGVSACVTQGYSIGEAVAPVVTEIGWSGRPGANLRGRKPSKPAKYTPAQLQMRAANDAAAELAKANADFDELKQLREQNARRNALEKAAKSLAAAKLVEQKLGVPQFLATPPVAPIAPIVAAAQKAPAKVARGAGGRFVRATPATAKATPTAAPALATPPPPALPAVPALDLSMFQLDAGTAGALAAIAAHLVQHIEHNHRQTVEAERAQKEEQARQQKIVRERIQWQQRIDKLLADAKTVGTRSRPQRSAQRH